jgi:hypothetical protein
MSYTLKDFIRCINRWLPETREYIWGRVTYIAFLAQYDIRKWLIFKRATKYTHGGEPISRTRFYISRFIVIESEDINEMEYEDLTGEYSIPQPIEERIKSITEKYGNYKNWQISLNIRRMLNLTTEKWRDYAGTAVDEYLHTEGYRIINKEI